MKAVLERTDYKKLELAVSMIASLSLKTGSNYGITVVIMHGFNYPGYKFFDYTLNLHTVFDNIDSLIGVIRKLVGPCDCRLSGGKCCAEGVTLEDYIRDNTSD